MRLVGMTMRIRRVLLGLGRMLMTGLVVVLPMMFGGGAMRFRGAFVVLGGFRVGFLRHVKFSCYSPGWATGCLTNAGPG